MIYIAAIFAALFFYTIWGRPPTDTVSEEAVTPTWRCTMKNKSVYTVAALTEADAMRELLKQKVDPSRIVILERVE